MDLPRDTMSSLSTKGCPDVFALLPAIPSLNNSYGAVLLGTYFGLMMYGFNMHQAYRYARLFPNDHTYVKSLVIVVLILETFHTVLCMHMSYYYLAVNYFDPLALLAGSWSIDLLPISAGVTIIACQTFFIRRLYLLVAHKYKLLVALVIGLLVGELAFSAAATAEAFIQPTFAKYQHVTWLISVGFSLAVVADGIITTVLIVSLRRSRTGVGRTDSVVDILILYAMTTGLFTSIFNTLAFLFALIEPNNLIYVGINIVASKLYATSLFAALNTRQALAQQGNGASTVIFGGTPPPAPGSTPRVTFPTLDRWSVARVPPTGTSDTALEDLHIKVDLERGLGRPEEKQTVRVQAGSSDSVMEMKGVVDAVTRQAETA
ncbi:hypothetical protein BD414DRAFT_164275 [Trametes punicea]|nr:hypothetical protein BD414DRAFT_164275 [Trametes punicea]